MTGPDPPIAELLSRHKASLVALIRREAGVALLRFDTIDDLLQGVRAEAIRSAASLKWRGEPAFVGWLHEIARRHLSARRDYWFACKRNPGALLRLTTTGSSGRPMPRAELADTATGPMTFAQRREMLVQATRAAALLLPRDRQIVQWTIDGLDARLIGERLGLSEAAADKARQRALERLRRTFELVGRSSRTSVQR
jgi:RNA polymerase sigma factor (sigma-70 family)